MVQPFPIIMAEAKTIPLFPGWALEAETGYWWFDTPLEIGGVTEEGLVLHGGCYRDYPDCNVTFELRAMKRPARRRIPLARLDWRSLSGGHTNRRRGESEWSGVRVGDTHLHDFDLNWLDVEKRMRAGNLPLARDIKETLTTFEDVRKYAGQVFRIDNMDIIDKPAWEHKLL